MAEFTTGSPAQNGCHCVAVGLVGLVADNRLCLVNFPQEEFIKGSQPLQLVRTEWECSEGGSSGRAPRKRFREVCWGPMAGTLLSVPIAPSTLLFLPALTPLHHHSIRCLSSPDLDLLGSRHPHRVKKGQGEEDISGECVPISHQVAPLTQDNGGGPPPPPIRGGRRGRGWQG